MYNWSEYQKAIFQDVKSGTGNTIIEALAGAAKTTSIIESLNHIPDGKTWLLVAFNKKIAEELRFRAPQLGGEVQTLHALGLKSLGATFKNIKVDVDKSSRIISKLIGDDKNKRELKQLLMKAVSLCKGNLINLPEEIDLMMDAFDIDPEGIERDQFISLCRDAMELAKNDVKNIDFDDMIFLPNVLKVKVPVFDMVFLDECQDVNKGMIGLFLQTIRPKPKTKRSKPEGRAFIVGDRWQQIYAWRGANADTFEFFQNTLKAKTLPLSISYRCPKSVIREAQRLVPAIESAPNAIEGKVESITYDEMKKQAKPGCFILSRVNAPLVGLAMHFLSKKIPCSINGRDIGINMLAMVERSKAKSLDKFFAWLEKWKAKEIARLVEAERDTSLVTDKVECFNALAESVDDLDELKHTIQMLFSDASDKTRITLSSIHRAKGDERDVVFILADTLRYYNQEEKNICYVAISRSKNFLFFVKD